MRRLAGTLAKLVLAALATFLLCETVLLLFNDVFFGRSFYGFDPDIGFRVRAHARYGDHEANEFGFNDRDHSHSREPGTTRILVLGDSFNWTFGPDGNYVGVLGHLLTSAFPRRSIEVINAGYPQTHTGQELAVLRKFGMQYAPDVVVLGFFVGNDFYDADPDRFRIVYGGATTDVRPGEEFYRVVHGQPLAWRSRLFLFLRERWNELRKVDAAEREQLTAPARVDGVRGVPPPPPDRARAATPLSEAYLAWLERRMEFAQPSLAPRFRRNETYVYESLLAMRDLLAANGIGFIVVAYPDAVQMRPDLQRAVVERAGVQPSAYSWTRAQQLLGNFCAEHDIEYHDILPAFAAASQRGWNLYLVNDSHWSAAGNVLAAEELSDVLAPRLGDGPDSHEP
jgi:lysophospholipase L1-like esterase